MTKKTMKSLARSIGKALKTHGHAVPHSVLLHVLASSCGKTDWHVLSASKDQAPLNATASNVRGALMSCIEMLQECLAHSDNDTAEAIDTILISAQKALELSVDGPPASKQLIEAAQLVLNRWEKGDLAEAVRGLELALAVHRLQDAPDLSIYQNLIKSADDLLYAFGGNTPDWLQEEAEALENAVEAAKKNPPEVQERPYTWDRDDEFPVEDWQHEVANDDTRSGYWDWVASKREQAEWDRKREEEEKTEVGETKAENQDSSCSCAIDPITRAVTQVNPHCRDHGEHRCECFNCGSIWDIKELNEIKRYWERVEEGEEEPDGECPKCGALCYLIEEDDEEESEVSLLEAATNFVDDYDDTGCDGCGVVSETSWRKLRNAMKAAQAGTPENPKLLTAASRAVDDYETEGCEDCGTVSEGAYKALRDIVSKLSKR